MDFVYGLIFGILFGIVIERGRFCMASAFRDLFLTRDTYLTKAVLLTVVLTGITFYACFTLGLIEPKVFDLSINTLIGGFLFGLGMVLAGGCMSGTLYRIGEGYVGSMVALLGVFTGIALFAWSGLSREGQKIVLLDFLPFEQRLIIWVIVGVLVGWFLVRKR
jgi:hypothetical protein